MKFFCFHLMPYSALDPDYDKTHNAAWVTLPNSYYDPKIGHQLYNPYLAKWLHRISVPTLFIWGDDDKVIPPGYGPAFRDLIPGSRLEVFAECGHIPHTECTEKWVETVAGFMGGIA